jgi:uncharacterized protein
MQVLIIVVIGAFNSGKTEFIRNISEIDVVSTELKREADNITIALDFGRLTLNEDTVIYFFGSPGARRFDVVDFQSLGSYGVLKGMVMMVRSSGNFS